jgi:hypothetical protein
MTHLTSTEPQTFFVLRTARGDIKALNTSDAGMSRWHLSCMIIRLDPFQTARKVEW